MILTICFLAHWSFSGVKQITLQNGSRNYNATVIFINWPRWFFKWLLSETKSKYINLKLQSWSFLATARHTFHSKDLIFLLDLMQPGANSDIKLIVTAVIILQTESLERPFKRIHNNLQNYNRQVCRPVINLLFTCWWGGGGENTRRIKRCVHKLHNTAVKTRHSVSLGQSSVPHEATCFITEVLNRPLPSKPYD